MFLLLDCAGSNTTRWVWTIVGFDYTQRAPKTIITLTHSHSPPAGKIGKRRNLPTALRKPVSHAIVIPTLSILADRAIVNRAETRLCGWHSAKCVWANVFSRHSYSRLQGDSVCTYSHSLPRRAGILATRCQIWSCIRFHVSSPVTCSKEYPLEHRGRERGWEGERGEGGSTREGQKEIDRGRKREEDK